MVSIHSCKISAFHDLYFKKITRNTKNAKVLLWHYIGVPGIGAMGNRFVKFLYSCWLLGIGTG